MNNQNKWFERYVLALAAVAAAFLLRHGIILLLGEDLPPWITFFPTIMLVALVTGFRPGILATVSASILAAYFYFPPEGLTVKGAGNIINIALFMTMGVLMSGVGRLYRRTRDRLESLVTERTLKLSQTNEELRREVKVRRQTEESLFESHSRLETLFAAIPYVILEYDTDLRPVRANAAALKTLGLSSLDFTRDQATAKLKFKNLDGSTAATENLPTSRALHGEMVAGDMYTITTNDGSEQVISTYAAPLKKDDKINGVVALWHDITDLKRAEESNNLLATIVESSDDAILSIGPDGAILSWNSGAERMFGYRAGEIIGRNINLLFPPECLEDEKQIIQKILQNERINHYETTRLAKDGRRLNVSVTVSPLKGRDGRIIGASKIIRDISGRKQAEKALHESRTKLEAALASMTDAVFISDVQGRFIDFNDAFATFHRFNSKDECSKTFAEYPDILDVYMADGTLAPLEMWAVPRALRGETVTNAEYTLRRKDTGETWVGSYSFGPIRDQNGAIVGSVVTGRDITEFKRAEEQIIERTEQLKSANETLCNARVAALNLMEDAVSARKLAEETNEELRREIAVRKRIEEALQKTHAELEAKVEERTAQLREKDQILLQQSRQAAMGEMIGNIAHQWRQPLNSLALLIGMLPAMQEKGELSTRELESLEEKAAGIIQHMSRTIEDFSNYFKPDKEKIIFHAGKAVETTLCLIEDNFRSREIAIEVRSTEDPVIKGYPNEFSQVLLNILINARDAFAESGINNPKVIINMTTENGGAVVTITDNAGGIPEEIINKIFDPYFTTKGPERGTGVGLFMSKGIIEKNMGGRLSARNTGKGAEFRIEV